MEPCTFRVSVEITEKTVATLLVSAGEGGADYWADFEARPYSPDGQTLSLPVVVRVFEDEDDAIGRAHILDMAAITRGLDSMARQYPPAFADIIRGTDDAETGDVFLQCALLGGIVYG